MYDRNMREALKEINEEVTFRFGLGTSLKLQTSAGIKEGKLYDVGQVAVTLWDPTDPEEEFTTVRIVDITEAKIVLDAKEETLPLLNGKTEREEMISVLRDIASGVGADGETPLEPKTMSEAANAVLKRRKIEE